MNFLINFFAFAVLKKERKKKVVAEPGLELGTLGFKT